MVARLFCLNKTVLYSYDTCGNIVSRCEYAYTTKMGEELESLTCTHYNYAYTGDKLTAYNGKNFSYNNLGNPDIYKGVTLKWQYGKQLIQYGNITFTYDGLGRRIGKNATKFIYDNDNKLIAQDNIKFIYDDKGLVGLEYLDNVYFYRKDVQGNVIAILDNTGNVVVKYMYDAWGNHSVSGSNIELGNINPFRYRGYYYDGETGLYYLQTRYYDPEARRFISQDDIDYADPETINGLNLYAYCGNNPVMNVDPTGCDFWSWLASLLQVIVGAILVVTGIAAGFGAALMIGGAMNMINLAFGSTVGGGISSMINGGGAFSTGLSLIFNGGVPGIIAGIGLCIIGGATTVMGANEVVSAYTGINYIRNWLGADVYNGLYTGLNIASTIGTVVGKLSLRAVNTKYSTKANLTDKPYAQVITNKNIYYYDGRGRAYWSDHNYTLFVNNTPYGRHWHLSLGRDGEHIYSYIEIIFRLIYGR